MFLPLKIPLVTFFTAAALLGNVSRATPVLCYVALPSSGWNASTTVEEENPASKYSSPTFFAGSEGGRADPHLGHPDDDRDFFVLRPLPFGGDGLSDDLDKRRTDDRGDDRGPVWLRGQGNPPINCSPIPEPAINAALLGLGAFSLVLLRRWSHTVAA